jgi:hypothetical protein
VTLRRSRKNPTERIEDASFNLPTKGAQLRTSVAAACPFGVLAAIELGGQAVSIRGTVANRVDPRLVTVAIHVRHPRSPGGRGVRWSGVAGIGLARPGIVDAILAESVLADAPPVAVEKDDFAEHHGVVVGIALQRHDPDW